MRNELGFLEEGFPTGITLVWFLPRVNDLMFNELRLPAKGPSARVAFITLHPRVNIWKRSDVWLLVEAFSQLVTFVRFLLHVHFLMRGEL